MGGVCEIYIWGGADSQGTGKILIYYCSSLRGGRRQTLIYFRQRIGHKKVGGGVDFVLVIVGILK